MEGREGGREGLVGGSLDRLVMGRQAGRLAGPHDGQLPFLDPLSPLPVLLQDPLPPSLTDRPTDEAACCLLGRPITLPLLLY